MYSPYSSTWAIFWIFFLDRFVKLNGTYTDRKPNQCKYTTTCGNVNCITWYGIATYISNSYAMFHCFAIYKHHIYLARYIHTRCIQDTFGLCRLFTLGTFPSNSKREGISRPSSCVCRKSGRTKWQKFCRYCLNLRWRDVIFRCIIGLSWIIPFNPNVQRMYRKCIH